MWYLYILRCADGSLYTGVTKDVEKRLAAHSGPKGSRYVRFRLPARLVHRESFRLKTSAFKREAEIKRWTRPKKLALLAENLPSSC